MDCNVGISYDGNTTTITIYKQSAVEMAQYIHPLIVYMSTSQT